MFDILLCICVFNVCVSYQLQKTDTQLTLVEFQLERSGSIDSYVQLRHRSFSRGGSPDTPQDHKIILKPSQLLKFALQVSRGMVSYHACITLVFNNAYMCYICSSAS